MLTAALIAPYFVNWTSYRADFEREASAVLGRKVTVEGDAQAWLVPFPSVSFSNVTVAAGANGEPAMTVETFSMDSELAPFLRGEFLIFDMRIVKPRVIVDVAQDGAIDWAMRPSSPFAAGQISVEKLTVSDGQVEVRHHLSGRTHLLTDINAELSAKSLAGPWRLDGVAKFDGSEASLSASTGAIEENGRMRLRIKAEPTAQPVALDADGELVLSPEGLAYTGTFRLVEAAPQGASAKTDRVQSIDAKQPEAPLFRFNGAFALNSRKLDVSEFRFETGPPGEPYTADGTASLDFGAEPHFAIKAKGAQVRFDEAVGVAENSQLTLEQRIEAFQDAVIRLPKPEIPGSIEVDLPAIVTGDTTIRDVRLAAEPGEGGWTIKSAHATLPGRTTVEADGFLQTEDQFGFNGGLLVAVGQPSGFAAWLARDVDDAIRKLPSAGFSAKVEISREAQLFRDLELVLGPAKFRGDIESRQPPDQRPSVLLKLDGGALDIEALSAFASLFISDAGENRFVDSDLDFQVKAGPISGAGLTADIVDTTLRLREGRLEIDRLSIDGLAGTSISATGSITDFPAAPAGNIDASLVSVDLAPLAKLVSDSFPNNPLAQQLRMRVVANPDLLTDARLDIVGSAIANGDGTTGVAFNLQGNAGGSALSASISGDGPANQVPDAKIKLELSARNDDATLLLALAGLPTTATPLSSLGAGELTLTAEGVAGQGMGSAIELKGDQFLASFNGTVALGDDGFTAKGKTRVQADDIEPWLTTVGMTLPGMGLGSTVEFAAGADLGSGLLVLEGIDGVVNETAVAGDLNVGFKEAVPNVSGALLLDALSLDPLAATAVGESALASESGWPTTPFSQQPALPLSAAIDVTAATLTAGSLSLQDATLALGVDSEGLRVNDLKASYAGGKLNGRFELKNNDGTGLASGQMQLTDFDLGSGADTDGLHGKGSISGTLTGNGKSVEALVASLSGSGTATFKGITVNGVNSNALPALLTRADAVGRDIDAAKVATFAPEIASQGSFAGGDAEVAFTVAGGILRAPPVTLQNSTARLSSDLRVDLKTGDILANGSVAYAAGENALSGSEPVLRFAASGRPGAIELTYDSEPLAQFLTQRALEREQARVEAMQAVLLEKQRLRREVRYYASLQAEREQAKVEALRKAEQDARQRAEDEARTKADEEERRRQAEEEAKSKAEADQRAATVAKRARLDAEVLERTQAAETQKRKTDAEVKRKAAAEQQAAAEQKAARQAEKDRLEAEEFERLKAEEEARQANIAAQGAKAVDEAPADLPQAQDIPVPRPRTIVPVDEAPAPAAPLKPSAIGTFIKSLTGG